MDSRATIQALMDSVQKADFDTAKSLLSADFMFSGPGPQPINGDAWMGLSRSMKTAFPNLNYNFKVHSMDGDTANISAQLNGTQSGALDLTGLHMGVIPATNKAFALEQGPGKVTVKGDKVTSLAMEPTPGTGMLDILNQLGVKPPTV